MSKYKYKKMIKVAIANEAFQDLMRKKESNSKMLELNYENLKIQRYLTSNIKMSDAEKCLLFKCGVREFPIKANYRNRYQKVKCSLCT